MAIRHTRKYIERFIESIKSCLCVQYVGRQLQTQGTASVSYCEGSPRASCPISDDPSPIAGFYLIRQKFYLTASKDKSVHASVVATLVSVSLIANYNYEFYRTETELGLMFC